MDIVRRIFIVEDDETIANMVAEGLSRWGFAAYMADDFSNILSPMNDYDPHLVLMDVALPSFNGYYWCEQIRKSSSVPVVFLSSHTDDMDIVMAMRMGGDDYISKPFSMEVLVAKIQAVLRRCSGDADRQELAFCGARLCAEEGCLHIGKEKVELTRNELRILQLLIENKQKIVTRERLMLKLWDSDSFIDDNTLTVNMNRLRKKLEAYGLDKCVQTKRGEGYLLDDA